jgi:hypothetical protein
MEAHRWGAAAPLRSPSEVHMGSTLLVRNPRRLQSHKDDVRDPLSDSLSPGRDAALLAGLCTLGRSRLALLPLHNAVSRLKHT